MGWTMQLDLEGKIVLVTGGSKGIGLACVRVFLAEGAKVAICSRSQANIDNALSALPPAFGVAADLTGAETAAQKIERVENELGPIDILVNCAGAARRVAPDELTPAAWREAFDAKFFTYINVMDPLVKRMAGRGRGVIVGRCRPPPPRFQESIVSHGDFGVPEPAARECSHRVPESGVFAPARDGGSPIRSRPTEVRRKGLLVELDEIQRVQIWWAETPRTSPLRAWISAAGACGPSRLFQLQPHSNCNRGCGSLTLDRLRNSSPNAVHLMMLRWGRRIVLCRLPKLPEGGRVEKPSPYAGMPAGIA